MSVRQAADQLAEGRRLVAAHFAAIDPRAELAWWLRFCRREYDRGHRDGYQAGYRQGHNDCDAQWMWILHPGREAAARLSREPTFAEVDKRRYPPGGRLSWLRPKGSDAA